MKLQPVDITKIKKISLRVVRTQHREEGKAVEPEDNEEPDDPPTAEDIVYSKLVAINPLIEDMVTRLNLVLRTGRSPRKVKINNQ